MMCGPRNEAETVKRGTESDMTEGTEETITDPEEVLAKTFTKRSSKKTEFRERNHLQQTFN